MLNVPIRGLRDLIGDVTILRRLQQRDAPNRVAVGLSSAVADLRKVVTEDFGPRYAALSSRLSSSGRYR